MDIMLTKKTIEVNIDYIWSWSLIPSKTKEGNVNTILSWSLCSYRGPKSKILLILSDYSLGIFVRAPFVCVLSFTHINNWLEMMSRLNWNIRSTLAFLWYLSMGGNLSVFSSPARRKALIFCSIFSRNLSLSCFSFSCNFRASSFSFLRCCRFSSDSWK